MFYFQTLFIFNLFIFTNSVSKIFGIGKNITNNIDLGIVGEIDYLKPSQGGFFLTYNKNIFYIDSVHFEILINRNCDVNLNICFDFLYFAFGINYNYVSFKNKNQIILSHKFNAILRFNYYKPLNKSLIKLAISFKKELYFIDNVKCANNKKNNNQNIKENIEKEKNQKINNLKMDEETERENIEKEEELGKMNLKICEEFKMQDLKFSKNLNAIKKDETFKREAIQTEEKLKMKDIKESERLRRRNIIEKEKAYIIEALKNLEIDENYERNRIKNNEESTNDYIKINQNLESVKIQLDFVKKFAEKCERNSKQFETYFNSYFQQINNEFNISLQYFQKIDNTIINSKDQNNIQKIKKVYRLQSLKLHPDKSQGNEEKFKKLNNYYNKLKELYSFN